MSSARGFLRAATVLALAGAALSVSIVSGALARSGGPSTGVTTIKTFIPGHIGFEHFVDVGRKGQGSGDYAMERSPLQSADGSKTIGVVVSHCVNVKYLPKARKASVLCDLQATLNGRGAITAYGEFLFGRTFIAEVALTGGTGEFAGARGTLTDHGSGAGDHLTFELVG